VFRFRVRVRTESAGDRAGLRITIPPSILRGLRHLGWDGKQIRVTLGTETFAARPRRQGASHIIALPKAHRGDVRVGDVVDLEVRDPGSEKEKGTVAGAPFE